MVRIYGTTQKSKVVIYVLPEKAKDVCHGSWCQSKVQPNNLKWPYTSSQKNSKVIVIMALNSTLGASKNLEVIVVGFSLWLNFFANAVLNSTLTAPKKI